MPALIPEDNAELFRRLETIQDLLAPGPARRRLVERARAEAKRHGGAPPSASFLLEAVREEIERFRQAPPPQAIDGRGRLENARQPLLGRDFSRKDYLDLYPLLSEATASRDLRLGVAAGLLTRRGDRAHTVYRWDAKNPPAPRASRPPAARRLLRALLFELASGNYRVGQRFLSHRMIMRLWKVSTPTAQEALNLLCRHDLLRAVAASGHYLLDGFHARACVLLADQLPPSAPVPGTTLPTTIAARRRQALRSRIIARQSESPAAPMRIGVVCFHNELGHGADAHLENAFKVDFAPGATARSIFFAAEKAGGMVGFFAAPAHIFEREDMSARIARAAPDGVVIIRRVNQPVAVFAEALLRRLIPVVAAFDDCEGTEMISVNFNNPAMGARAAQILLEHGHRRIGVLHTDTPAQQTRANGLEDAVTHAGGEVFRLCLPSLPASQDEAAQEAAAAIARHGVTALYAASHDLLDPLLPLLRGGARKPLRLSVLSSSSTPKIALAPGKVDILRMDFSEIGRLAWHALNDFRHGQVSQRCYLLNPGHEPHGTVRRVAGASRRKAPARGRG